METTKKLVKISHSLGIIIDKPLVEKMDLKQGDLVHAKFEKIEEDSEKK